jgi:hypothetical protein
VQSVAKIVAPATQSAAFRSERSEEKVKYLLSLNI